MIIIKFLLLGRTATGKDTLANILQKKYNWKFVKSYTTRPKRFLKEDTHIFVNKVENKNILAYEYINGFDYYATVDQFKECDAYIISPNALKGMLLKLREEGFEDKIIVVYIKPTNTLKQKKMFINREISIENTNTLFKNRFNSENKMFSEFEDNISQFLKENRKIITAFIPFENDYNISTMEKFANTLNDIKQ